MTRSSRVVCVGAQQAAVCVFVALLAVRLSSLGGAEARQKSAISSEGTRLARHPGADGTPTRQSARGLWGPATYPNGTARPHGLRPWELAADVADVFGANPAKGHPSFDHQTVEYDAQFKPVNTPHDAQVTLTPFFSPDSSISTLTALIQGVKQGGQIDVGTPGISSWSGCTNFDSGCAGCYPSRAAREEFPIFGALLNAIHQKGARVRVVTNGYGTSTCPGMVAPLDYLSLNGADIVTYTSTTFYHAKYMRVDNVTAVSSINWSYTSFMENREAGLLLQAGTEEVQAIMNAVFDFDHKAGSAYHVNQTYSADDLAIIQSAAAYTVTVPPPKHLSDSQYVTPTPAPLTSATTAGAIASPDFAFATVLPALDAAKRSIAVMVYQITDPALAQALVDAHKRGVNVTVLVSSDVFDEDDRAAAQVAYGLLNAGGVVVRQTPNYYHYSHQKWWIVDGATLFVCTGNWSPSDFPDKSTFAPYPDPAWTRANRDFTITSQDPALLRVFSDLLDADNARGSVWTPQADPPAVADASTRR